MQTCKTGIEIFDTDRLKFVLLSNGADCEGKLTFVEIAGDDTVIDT